MDEIQETLQKTRKSDCSHGCAASAEQVFRSVFCFADRSLPDLSLGLLGRPLLVSDNLKFLTAFPHFNFTLANNFSRQQPSQ